MSNCGCGTSLVRANTGDSDCIAMTGVGSISNPIVASPIVDPDARNTLACGPSGLLSVAPPDLFVEGGVPPGSIPPIPPLTDVAGLGPDWPSPCGGFLTPIGPQADILVSNPTPYSFLLVGTVTPAGAVFTLDPGTSLNIGWAINSAGVNLPPAPITFPAATFYGGYRNTTPGCQTINPDAAIPEFSSGVILGPGDFVWFSLQTLILLTGSGPATSVGFIAGSGVRGSVRGVRQ